MKIETFYRKNLRNDKHFQFENFIRTLNAVIAKYTAMLNSRLGKMGRKEAEISQTNGGSV